MKHILDFFIAHFNSIASHTNGIFFKYLWLYLFTVYFIYVLVAIYDLLIIGTESLITGLYFKINISKNLKIAWKLNLIKYYIDNILSKIPLGFFEDRYFYVYLSMGDNLLYVLEGIKSILIKPFRKKYINVLAIIIVLDLSNTLWFTNTKNFISFVVSNIYQYLLKVTPTQLIESITYDKIKFLLICIVLFAVCAYFINSIIFIRFKNIAKFGTALLNIEDAKIKKVVNYQEEILDLLKIIHKEVFENVEIISKLFRYLKSRYNSSNIDYNDIKDSYINYLNNYEEKLTMIDEKLMILENEKLLSTYQNYNKEFLGEMFKIRISRYSSKLPSFHSRLSKDKFDDLIKNNIDDIMRYSANDEEIIKNQIINLTNIIQSVWNDAIEYLINSGQYISKFEKRRIKFLKYTDIDKKFKNLEDRITSKVKV